MLTPHDTLREIVKRVGGEMYLGGRAALVPSPGHGPKDRGLSLRIKGEPPRILWWSHNGAQAADVWRHLGLEPGEARQETEAEKRRRQAEERAERERKRLFCADLWRATVEADATLVDIYLRSRGITGPIPRAIRFHPAAPLRYPDPDKGPGRRHPAMVAIATGPDGRTAVGLHVTALKPDGSAKADMGDFSPKRMFGEFSGAVVQLGSVPDDGRLGVAEGIETALAYRDLTGLPTWAALSTSGLRSFSPPEGVRHLTIAADGDEAGREAGRVLAERARRRCDCTLAPAPQDRDWADALKGGA